MIVAPDFLDHWKNELLRNLLDDQAAPLLVLRLWATCQLRKSDRIERASPAKLAAVCRYTGDPQVLWDAMLECEWVEVDGDTLVVHQWAEMNASLIASWDNGRRGGRPRKPTGNPRVTHGEPTANPDETDKIRVDQIREKRGEPPPPPQGAVNGVDLEVENCWKWFTDLMEQHRLSVPTKLTPERKRAIRARIKDGMDATARETISEKVGASSFLRGIGGRDGWKGVTFDFLFLRKSSWLKVVEGNYDDGGGLDKW